MSFWTNDLPIDAVVQVMKPCHFQGCVGRVTGYLEVEFMGSMLDGIEVEFVGDAMNIAFPQLGQCKKATLPPSYLKLLEEECESSEGL